MLNSPKLQLAQKCNLLWIWLTQYVTGPQKLQQIANIDSTQNPTKFRIGSNQNATGCNFGAG